ncbi:class I SAM-dependent methyltransferase [Deinococcus sp. HMF7604]|uniref:class I SAM-dependent methyltransferase n=1 Tax=Deinococcus betulae TaxID=2873312 RepID=UPI001CCC82E5|nr:class I SAM-dependent methyltransferase [Deinococcus betulae]MBZ9752043.1 class I SAM-dependent methyltransferase [Deinococcus betulae]
MTPGPSPLAHAWAFDELRTAGPEHLDAGQVAAYDARAQFDPAPDIDVLKALGLSRQDTVLDMGAGTGTFAVAAAPLCRQVLLVEPSRAMLDAAAEKLRAAALDNVRLIKGSFLSLQVASPVEFIFCRNALHHLPDFWKVQALRRLRAALKPGGVLRLKDIAFSFAPAQTEASLSQWLEAAAHYPPGSYTADMLATHIREEFSTFTWLLEPMLERSGFCIEQAEYSSSGVFAAYICRAA